MLYRNRCNNNGAASETDKKRIGGRSTPGPWPGLPVLTSPAPVLMRVVATELPLASPVPLPDALNLRFEPTAANMTMSTKHPCC